MSRSPIVRRVLKLLLSSPLIAVVESEGMANPEYVWWIAEHLPPAASGGVQAQLSIVLEAIDIGEREFLRRKRFHVG